MRPDESTVRRALLSLVTLVGGVSLAVVPAVVVAIAARLFTRQEQGAIAVAVLVATFAGQLAFAVVVESRLSTPGSERRVVLPRVLVVATLVAALVVAVTPPNAVVLCLALPVMVAGLEVGRGVSVAERLDRREVVASLCVGAGALAGVVAGFFEARWALVPLVAGIALATLARSRRVPHRASRTDPRVLGWILGDTAITGVVPPLLNGMILAFLGAGDAILFTAVATVSGLLAIPLNFMRLRLLKEHSRLDIAVTAASVLGAVGVLAVLELTGVFTLFFGSAWTIAATLVPLLAACAWRAASLPTTIPFAGLRRHGAVRLLTALRAAVSVVTFGLAALGVAGGGLALVFVGLLAAELVSAVVYQVAWRRVTQVRETAPA